MCVTLYDVCFIVLKRREEEKTLKTMINFDFFFGVVMMHHIAMEKKLYWEMITTIMSKRTTHAHSLAHKFNRKP